MTTLDVIRAARFISEIQGIDPAHVKPIPIVGGHSGTTIVPLLSQAGYALEGEELETFVHRVQFGGDEVVKAKAGAGSATLAMAVAAARFTESLLGAMQGKKGVIEPSFVDSPLYKDQGIDFVASNVELGPKGVEEILPIGKISRHEQEMLDGGLQELKASIAKGTKFAKENP